LDPDKIAVLRHESVGRTQGNEQVEGLTASAAALGGERLALLPNASSRPCRAKGRSSDQFAMHFPWLYNGAIKIGIRTADLCNKERRAMLIQLYSGKTVATFFPIKRAYRNMRASFACVATEQARDLSIGHPDLRHVTPNKACGRQPDRTS
jgi:hypothetical protein